MQFFRFAVFIQVGFVYGNIFNHVVVQTELGGKTRDGSLGCAITKTSTGKSLRWASAQKRSRFSSYIKC